jgi:hypothetical protein
MAYRAIVYSVPGTGTRFCCDFLSFVLGYKQAPLNELDNINTYVSIHSGTINRINRVMEKYPDVKLVVPLRDPYLAYTSRYHLDYPVRDSGTQNNKNRCVEYWQSLIETTALYPTVFLPINCNEKDRLLNLVKVGKYLGANTNSRFIDYATNWTAIGSDGMNELKHEYIERGTIDSVKPTFLDFAVNWMKGK